MRQTQTAFSFIVTVSHKITSHDLTVSQMNPTNLYAVRSTGTCTVVKFGADMAALCSGQRNHAIMQS